MCARRRKAQWHHGSSSNSWLLLGSSRTGTPLLCLAHWMPSWSCGGWSSVLFSFLSEPGLMFDPIKAKMFLCFPSLFLCLSLPACLLRLWRNGRGASSAGCCGTGCHCLRGFSWGWWKRVLNPGFDRRSALSCSVHCTALGASLPLEGLYFCVKESKTETCIPLITKHTHC